jgi:hypothetical protein
MCLLQYVDNLLLSGDNQEEVINTTISFINFLGSWGLHISKNKLQFAETEVKYLGHLISKERRIGPERIEGITGLPLPGTKQELRKFLGFSGLLPFVDRLISAPRKNTGLSPYEMLHGLPYLSSVTDVPSFETKDYFLKNYMLGLSSTLLCLR